MRRPTRIVSPFVTIPGLTPRNQFPFFQIGILVFPVHVDGQYKLMILFSTNG